MVVYNLDKKLGVRINYPNMRVRIVFVTPMESSYVTEICIIVTFLSHLPLLVSNFGIRVYGTGNIFFKYI